MTRFRGFASSEVGSIWQQLTCHFVWKSVRLDLNQAVIEPIRNNDRGDPAASCKLAE